MKPWYTSKTLWFNVLAVVVAIAGIFGFADFQPSNNVLELIGILVPAINFALRLITKQAIGNS